MAGLSLLELINKVLGTYWSRKLVPLLNRSGLPNNWGMPLWFNIKKGMDNLVADALFRKVETEDNLVPDVLSSKAESEDFTFEDDLDS